MQELEGVGSPVRMQLFVECNLAQSLAFMSIYCRQKATEAKLFTPQTSQRIQPEPFPCTSIMMMRRRRR